MPVTANRSLDEFGGGPDAPAEAGTSSGDGDGSPPAADPPAEEPPASEGGRGDEGAPGDGSRGGPEPGDEGDVDPPVSTYTWSPEGGPCAACGGQAEERWRAGDELVCADCKEW